MKNLFLLAFICTSLFTSAQTIEFDAGEEDSRLNFLPIYDEGEIYGYANCVVVDSDGPNAKNYELRIYNSKLELKLTKEFTSFYKLSVSVLYDGEKFFCQSTGYFNRWAQEAHNRSKKDKSQVTRVDHDIQVFFFDNQGNDISNFSAITEKIKNPDVGDLGKNPVVHMSIDYAGGYIVSTVYTPEGEKRENINFVRGGRILERFNKNGEKLWEYLVSSDRGPIYSTHISSKSEEHLLVKCTQKTVAKKKEPSVTTIFMQVLDNATGKIISTLDMPVSETSQKMGYAFLNSEQQEISILGSDFKPDEKKVIRAEDMLGLFLKKLSYDGTLISDYHLEWKDVISKLSEEDQSEIKSSSAFRLQVYKKLENGNYRIILEHYTEGRSADAKTEDHKLVRQAFFKLNLLDFFQLEVSPELDVVEVKRFEKEKGSGHYTVFGPNYRELKNDITLLEQSAARSFAYNFYSTGAGNGFILFYGEKKEELKGSGRNVCYFGEDKNGEKVQGQIEINSKATKWEVYPATFGYVTILEKFPKENTYVARVEKIDI